MVQQTRGVEPLASQNPLARTAAQAEVAPEADIGTLRIRRRQFQPLMGMAEERAKREQSSAEGRTDAGGSADFAKLIPFSGG